MTYESAATVLSLKFKSGILAAMKGNVIAEHSRVTVLQVNLNKNVALLYVKYFEPDNTK